MKLRATGLAVVAFAALTLVACAPRELKLADATTRAVYDNNADAVMDHFTPELRQQITRAQVGALSDVMHQHGDYKGLTETGTEPDGAYDFRADFSNGGFVVKMKLDSSGKISGYRVIPSK